MNTPLKLEVSLGDRSYPIYIGEGLLSKADAYLSLSRRVLIVTDDGVPAVYAQKVAALAQAPTVVTIPQGERSKSFSSLEMLCRKMLEEGFTRGDCVVAVGGGIVGDLAGFAAASFMRGIDFYNIPTTLLSQVDSSIGGKVAINLDRIKNAVGAFYQPRAVLIDTDVLKTLPRRQIAAGLAEALKMSITFDEELFARFEKGEAEDHLSEIILSSLKLKRDVVEKDEKESSLRRVLNFGHTVGHGIESLFGIGEDNREEGLYHGECVALGMIPMCSEKVKARLIPVLEKLGLPTKISVDASLVSRAMTHDKKAGDGYVTVILVDEIGSYREEKMSFAALKRRLEEKLP